MKRILSVTLAVGVMALLAGAALAQMGGAAGQAGAGAQPAQITEEKAKELAQQYADSYLKGFTVERVLPFTGGHGTMYSVELKGPDGEFRTFHINPWGNVMPFGGAQRRSG